MGVCFSAFSLHLDEIEDYETTCQRRVRLSLDDASLRVHNLWSGLLRLHSRFPPNVVEVPQYMQSNYDALGDSLSDPVFSFLAARYLCLALEHILPTLVNSNIHMVGMWHRYMDGACSKPETIEWSIFNDCIKWIHSCDQPITAFVSPSDLAKLALPVAQNADLLPNIFTVFLSRPLLSFTIQSTNTKAPISSTKVEHLIRASIFGERRMRECCNLIDDALDTYRNGFPYWKVQSFRNLPNLDSSRLNGTSGALLLFLFARYVGIDRYCKHATILERQLLPSSLINSVRSLVGRTKETTLPLFDNIPYLRRFRLRDGSFFVTSDHLPEPPNLLIEDATKSTLRDFSVDTILLGVDMVLWLRIDESWPPFDATGHYPILAGANQHGEELYVAAAKVDSTYYFTCVEGGAESVTYTDEVGDQHGTDNFFVLALRYDPSDVTPPYPHTPAGAMDPTGPLHWLKFWPERDPDYIALSDSASDDRRLESLLNSFSENTSADRDIWWWN